jgi:hypothetical protein
VTPARDPLRPPSWGELVRALGEALALGAVGYGLVVLGLAMGG